MKQLDLSKIKARLERIPDQFTDEVAQVGFPAGKNYEDGTPVAYVAAIQEFGAPEVKIPPRPFIQPTVKAKSQDWVDLMKAMVPKVGDGGMSAYDVLDAVGRVAVGDIQETISRIESPALSPITVLLRKWRKAGKQVTGRTVGEAARAIDEGVDPGDDDKPLNDTGLMFASVLNGVNKPGGDFSV